MHPRDFRRAPPDGYRRKIVCVVTMLGSGEVQRVMAGAAVRRDRDQSLAELGVGNPELVIEYYCAVGCFRSYADVYSDRPA